jgi:hypothetical protein
MGSVWLWWRLRLQVKTGHPIMSPAAYYSFNSASGPHDAGAAALCGNRHWRNAACSDNRSSGPLLRLFQLYETPARSVSNFYAAVHMSCSVDKPSPSPMEDFEMNIRIAR